MADLNRPLADFGQFAASLAIHEKTGLLGVDGGVRLLIVPKTGTR